MSPGNLETAGYCRSEVRTSCGCRDRDGCRKRGDCSIDMENSLPGREKIYVPTEFGGII